MTMPMARRGEVQCGDQLIKLSPTESDIVAALLISRPRAISGYVLADLIYGGRLDGGPENARNAIEVLIVRLRAKGVPVGHRRSFGYLI